MYFYGFFQTDLLLNFKVCLTILGRYALKDQEQIWLSASELYLFLNFQVQYNPTDKDIDLRSSGGPFVWKGFWMRGLLNLFSYKIKVEIKYSDRVWNIFYLHYDWTLKSLPEKWASLYKLVMRDILLVKFKPTVYRKVKLLWVFSSIIDTC